MNKLSANILFLESSKNLGGQEFQLLQQMKCLSLLGVKVGLVCQTKSPIAVLASTRGLEVTTTSLKKGLDLRGISRVLYKILKDSPRALIVHSGHDALIGSFSAKCAFLVGIRTRVIRMRTYQPADKIPSSLIYNNLFSITYTPSEFLRSILLKNSKIKPKKISVLYPGIDFDALKNEATLPDHLLRWLATHPGPIIAQGAMLRGEKGHVIILNAMPELLKQFPNIRYVVAGEGPELNKLSKLVSELKLEDHVYFAGLVQPISSLLKISTLALMPSLREPLGMFQIESQYLGVPTIASNVDGIPETLVHKKTGLLVEPGNVKEWINHIAWALQNLDEMKIWAAQGSIYVKEKFSMESNTQQLLKILDIRN